MLTQKERAMTTNAQNLINNTFSSFGAESRVWLYLASRPFTPAQTAAVQSYLHDFCANWKAHGAPLTAGNLILFNQLIVISVNEEVTGASGCSIDSSVHAIQNLENQLGLKLLEKGQLAWLEADAIQQVPFSQVKNAIQSGIILPDNQVINLTISQMDQLRSALLIPAMNSWAAKYFTLSQSV